MQTVIPIMNCDDQEAILTTKKKRKKGPPHLQANIVIYQIEM